MTVSSTVSKSGPYAGAGTTGPFTVGFRFLDNSHLQVVRTAADGTDTTLVLNADYSVTGAGAASGTVTLVTALAVGQKLTIVRNVPATQEADYVENDAFPAESHETALDKLTMLVQQNGEAIGRAIKVRVSDAPLSDLPSPSARANTVVGFDALGNVTVLPVPSSIGAGDRIPYSLVSGVNFAPGATQVTLPRPPGSAGNLEVNFDGGPQEFAEWSVAGQTLTFTSPIPAFITKIWGYIGTTLSTQIPPDGSVTDANVATNAAIQATKLSFKRPEAGTVTRNLRDVMAEMCFNVMDFGALGDGSHDDTAAINNAILAAEAAGGGTVFFPATDYLSGKWYRCNGTIFLSATRDVELLGEGNTMIKSHASSTLTDLLVIGDPLNVQNRSFWVKLNNLKLWSATGTNGNGIRAIRVNNLRVHNCSVFNHGVNGGYFSDTYTFHMEDSEFVGNINGNGLRVTSAGGNNSSITRSKFNGNGTSANLQGVRIEGAQYNVIIDKCDFEFNYQGITADTVHALSVTQCYFEGNTSAAVYIPPGTACRGVTLAENSVLNTYFDINSVAGVSVYGNVFEAPGAVLNIGSCTEVDIGPNSFPGGGTIATDNNGHTDFSALGGWLDYTPTWTTSGTQPVVGNGVLQGYWKRIGKTCHVRIRLLAGSTTTFGTGIWFFALPFTSVNVGQAEWYGTSKHNNGGTTKLSAIIPIVTANVASVSLLNAGDASSVTATSPATWANGDAIQMLFTYETA